MSDPDVAGILEAEDAGGAALRGSAVRIAGYVFGILISVASAAPLFRHLGVDSSGQYVTVLSLATLAGSLTDAGLTAIGVREFSTSAGADRWRMMRALLGVRLLLSLLGVLAAVVFAVVAGYPGLLVAGTAIAGSALIVATYQGTLAVGLLAGLRLGTVTTLDLIRQTSAAVLVITLVLAGAQLTWFWVAAVAASVITLAATAVRTHATTPLFPSFDRGEWRRLLKDVVPFAVSTAVSAVYFRLGIIIVSLVDPGRQTGLFGASFRVVEVMVVIPILVVSSAFPIFAHAAANDRARLLYALGRTLEACLIIGVGIAVTLAVGAPFIIDVIAGQAFAAADGILRLHGVALALAFVNAVLGYGLLSIGAYRSILAVNLSGLVVSAVATFVLTEVGRAHGTVVGVVLGEITLAGASFYALRRAGIVRLTSLRFVLGVLTAGALAALLLFAPLPSVIATVLAVVVYGLGLLALRVVPEEILVEARRRLKR